MRNAADQFRMVSRPSRRQTREQAQPGRPRLFAALDIGSWLRSSQAAGNDADRSAFIDLPPELRLSLRRFANL